MMGSFLAVEECDDVVVVQLGELLEDLDLLAKQVLAFRQVLLRDRLDRHHVARRTFQFCPVDDGEGTVANHQLGGGDDINHPWTFFFVFVTFQ